MAKKAKSQAEEEKATKPGETPLKPLGYNQQLMFARFSDFGIDNQRVGLSVENAARLTGMTPQEWQNLERGITPLTYDQLDYLKKLINPRRPAVQECLRAQMQEDIENFVGARTAAKEERQRNREELKALGQDQKKGWAKAASRITPEELKNLRSGELLKRLCALKKWTARELEDNINRRLTVANWHPLEAGVVLSWIERDQPIRPLPIFTILDAIFPSEDTAIKKLEKISEETEKLAYNARIEKLIKKGVIKPPEEGNVKGNGEQAFDSEWLGKQAAIKQIGLLVFAYRKKLGIDQETLGKALERQGLYMSAPNVSDLEAGKLIHAHPRGVMIFAKVLQVPEGALNDFKKTWDTSALHLPKKTFKKANPKHGIMPKPDPANPSFSEMNPGQSNHSR